MEMACEPITHGVKQVDDSERLFVMELGCELPDFPVPTIVGHVVDHRRVTHPTRRKMDEMELCMAEPPLCALPEDRLPRILPIRGDEGEFHPLGQRTCPVPPHAWFRTALGMASESHD